MAEFKTGVCEVHERVFGDKTKRKVFYCTQCNAWMCEQCRDKPLARAGAAVHRGIDNFFTALLK